MIFFDLVSILVIQLLVLQFFKKRGGVFTPSSFAFYVYLILAVVFAQIVRVNHLIYEEWSPIVQSSMAFFFAIFFPMIIFLFYQKIREKQRISPTKYIIMTISLLLCILILQVVLFFNIKDKGRVVNPSSIIFYIYLILVNFFANTVRISKLLHEDWNAYIQFTLAFVFAFFFPIILFIFIQKIRRKQTNS